MKNREIKFRAWGNQMNRSVPRRPDGCVAWTVHMKYNPDIFNGHNSSEAADINAGIAEEQERGIVFMQFTGLRDKKKKKVWEGDILENPRFGKKNWERLVVIWDVELARFGLKFYSPHGGEGHTGRSQDIDNYIRSGCYVIGNIYENHELIK